jgi:hypothetical protein
MLMEECFAKFMLFFRRFCENLCYLRATIFLTDSTDCTDYNLCLQGPPTAEVNSNLIAITSFVQ